MYINQVVLYGRLGADPELKNLPSGSAVCNFSIATTRQWKDKDGQKQELTEWSRCVCFGKRAEVIARYVHKGDKFYIMGRLQTRSWEQDGVKKYSTEIIIDNFEFGDNPKRQQSESEGSQVNPKEDAVEYPSEEDINPDDIPF